MALIGTGILEQVGQLCELTSNRLPQHTARRLPLRSPADLMERLLEVVMPVDSRAFDHLEGDLNRHSFFIGDLFAFLQHFPPDLSAQICKVRKFPEEPLRAWNEPHSDALTGLAALVQDVWEHTFGPEAGDDPGILSFIRHLSLRDVLDFGSGIGFFAFPLARDGVRVTCVEPNRVKRRFLRFRCAHRPEGRNITLRFVHRQYGAILAMNVLDHVSKPECTVRMLASHTKTGGLLVCRASFPDDGWHAGGERVRQGVYQELISRYRYTDPPLDSVDETMVFKRRRGTAIPVAKRSGIRLHPAAVLAPAPGLPDLFILTARRFYVSPLLLSSQGAELAKLCRSGKQVGEITELMCRKGAEKAEIRQALREMVRARLLLTR